MRSLLLGTAALALLACHPSHPVADAGTGVSFTVVSVTPGMETPINADWVAFQSGSTGAWTPLSGETGRYRFVPTSADWRLGLVVVCPATADQPRTVRSYQGTLLELDDLKVGCAGAPAVTLPVDFASSGWDAAATQASAALEGSVLSSTTQGVASDAASLIPGQSDLLAWTLTATGQVDQIALTRAVAIDGSNPHLSLTFAPASGAAVGSALYTLAGVDDDDVSVSAAALLFTASASVLPLPALGAAPALPSPTFSTFVVPTALLTPGDVQVVSFTTGGRQGFSRGAIQSTAHAKPATLTLPPALTTAAFLLPQASWSGGPSLAGARLQLAQSTTLRWEVLATAGFLQGASTAQVPDPSSAAGWDDDWALRASLPLTWTLDVVDGNPALIAPLSSVALRDALGESSATVARASGVAAP